MTFPDPDHSAEHRAITVGYTMKGHVGFVSHCERGKMLRIISARLATRRERQQYEEDDSQER
jgi:uncharacterized DUF497 family protein